MPHARRWQSRLGLFCRRSLSPLRTSPATLRSRSSVLCRTAVCACDHRTHRPHTGCYQRVITGRTVLLPGCDQRVSAFDNPARHFWRNGTPEGRGATAHTAHTREAALYRGGSFSPDRVEKPPHTPAILWMSQAVSTLLRRYAGRALQAARTGQTSPAPRGAVGSVGTTHRAHG
jgi:hypothetical protein